MNARKLLIAAILVLVLVLIPFVTAFADTGLTKTCTKSFYVNDVKVATQKLTVTWAWNASNIVRYVSSSTSYNILVSGYAWTDKRATLVYDWGSYISVITQADLVTTHGQMIANNSYVMQVARDGSSNVGKATCSYGQGN